MPTRKIRTGIGVSLLLALGVMTALALYADLPHMAIALARFRWQYLPVILALTLSNYAWRFVKWQYYLRRLQIRLPWYKSLLVSLSGLSMAITPGKVGEILKAYQLKRATGVEISRTTPIIVAERLTDGIALFGLASTGLVLYHFGWQILVTLLLCSIAGILLVQNRQLMLKLLNIGEQVPAMSRISHVIRSFYESAYTLLQWQALLIAIAIGLISWSGECGALYFVYSGLGVAASLDLFIKAMFILAVSSLVGSASGLPAGLGTADSSMVGLTRLLISTSATLAGAATLLIRLCTLWFGLLVGGIAALLFHVIQRVDVSHPVGVGGEELDHKQDLPMHARLPRVTPASTSAATGEKVV